MQQPHQYDQILLDNSSSDDPNIFSLPIETPPSPIFCNYVEQNSQNFAENGSESTTNDNFYPPLDPFFDSSATHLNNGPSNKILGQQKPCVKIVVIEQPIERCRFRYKAEQGPHGALKGVSAKGQKSVPKIKVERNFTGTGYVLASLWTNEDPPRPHVNELWGSECDSGFCKVDVQLSNTVIGFPNLGIMRQKEKDIVHILLKNYTRDCQATGAVISDQMVEALREKAQKETATMKDCLHCVRLGFQAFLTDVTGQIISSPIVWSTPIYNSQNPGFSALQIAEVDRSFGCCSGGDVVWLRCATKIRRDQIKVIFCESSSDWESEANFSPNDVYEQILIIFKTPPYKNLNITEKTAVHIKLLRTTDGECSPPLNFVYLPKENGPVVKRTKRTIETPDFYPGLSSDYAWLDGPCPKNYQAQTEQNFFGIDPTNFTNFGHDFEACASKEPPTSQPGHNSRKRQLEDPDKGSGQKLRSLDSGIESLRSVDPNDLPGSSSSFNITATPSSLTSEIESLTLAEYASSKKLLDDLKRHLKSVTESQTQALWTFSSEGDLTALIHANAQLIGIQDNNGNNAIHICAKSKQPFALKSVLKVLDQLPNKKAIINMQNHTGQTPLHLAIKYGDPDCVHYLLKSGSDIKTVDSLGNGAAHYLAETFNESIYRDILFPPQRHNVQQIIDLDFLNNEGTSPVHLAVKKNKLALLESLVDAKADLNLPERCNGKTALHMAVERADLDILNFLIQHNANIDQEMYDGTTALQLAVLMKRDLDILRALVNAGADPSLKTSTINPNFASEDDNEELISGEVTENQRYSAIDFVSAEDDGKPIIALLQQLDSRVTSEPIQSTSASFELKPRPTELRQFAYQDFNDDLCMLDFLTRLRLGKLLDKEGRWERLASTLNCDSNMIECVRICAHTEASSATSFLLDQLEQIPHFTISRLVQGLERINLTEAIDLVNQRLWKR